MNAIAGLNHLNLAVSNLETSFNFYNRKLNFKPLAKWKRGAYFLAGPSIAYAMDGKLRTKINSIIDINLTKTNINLANEDYNRFEFAGVVGTGAFININNAKLFAEFKYHHGFSDLLDDPILDIQLKNRAFGIGMGLQIAL